MNGFKIILEQSRFLSAETERRSIYKLYARRTHLCIYCCLLGVITVPTSFNSSRIIIGTTDPSLSPGPFTRKFFDK